MPQLLASNADRYNTNIIADLCQGMNLVITTNISKALNSLRMWILPQREQHFLIVGEPGSGKRSVFAQFIMVEQKLLDNDTERKYFILTKCVEELM